MYLYHYYDRRSGPFRSLTALPHSEAQSMLTRIKKDRPGSFCAKRDESYLLKRRSCEAVLRREFEARGGIIDIETPYYMVLGHSPWLSTWYEQGECVKIPVKDIDLRKISFTYGDSMPTFNPNVNADKEYHMKLYFYSEILELIKKYGLPQEYNDDGALGVERYIEVQVWTEGPLKRYLTEIQK